MLASIGEDGCTSQWQGVIPMELPLPALSLENIAMQQEDMDDQADEPVNESENTDICLPTSDAPVHLLVLRSHCCLAQALALWLVEGSI